MIKEPSERGLMLDTWGWKQCDCTSTLQAAMVNTSRAWQDAHTGGGCQTHADFTGYAPVV